MEGQAELPRRKKWPAFVLAANAMLGLALCALIGLDFATRC